MQFQVPQFVEVEDKIFWKLTLKQFIYVAGGGGLCLILYLSPLPFLISLMLMAPVAAFSLALAFYRYNDRPFIVLVESAAKYIWNGRLYIWRKVDVIKAQSPEKKEDDLGSLGLLPKLGNSRLKELTWSLDAKEAINPVTKDGQTK